MTEPYKCSFHSLTNDDIFREILKSLEIISSQLGELKTETHLSHSNNAIFSDKDRRKLHSDCGYPPALRRCGIFDARVEV